MRKILSLLLTVTILLGLLPIVGISASAEWVTDSQGVSYMLSEDGTFYIVYGCDRSATDIVIPESINDKPVKEIGEYAFNATYISRELVSIEISDSVELIGAGAFLDCNSLEYVRIGDSVTNIEQSAFEGCNNLKTVHFGNSLIAIKECAFSRCSSLEQFTLPDSLTEIEKGAFLYCDSIISLTIPDSVSSIGSYAFSGCSRLENVVLSNSLITINREVFSDCECLSSVVISDSVQLICGLAFEDCRSLVSIAIPDSVIYMDAGVFMGCSNLTDIYCEAKFKPYGWDEGWIKSYQWDGDVTVHWGCNSAGNIKDDEITHVDITINVPKAGSPVEQIGIAETTPSVGNKFKISVLWSKSTTNNTSGWEAICTDDVFEKGYYYLAEAWIYSDLGIYEGLADDAFWTFSETITANINGKPHDGRFEIFPMGYADGIVRFSYVWYLGDVAKGDINNNGKIDARDYLLLKRAYFGTYNLTCDLSVADINGNGKLDARDYLLLKRAYFGTYTIQ